MSEFVAPELGPAPFRFAPQEPDLTVRAFSWPFRAMALGLVSVSAVWMLQLSERGALGSGLYSGQSWFAAGWLMMAYTVWHIWRSRTRLTGQALTQSWIWDKKVELRELAYARVIRVRGLEWLVAPRLYARMLNGKFAVLYACDPRMLSEFERLAVAVTQFRLPR